MEGKLTRAEAQDSHPHHLQLGERVLNANDPLFVRIQGYWVQGRIEFDRIEGWYLDTNVDTDPLIVLRSGIIARIDES